MKWTTATVLLIPLVASASAQGQAAQDPSAKPEARMVIVRNGSQPARTNTTTNLTGNVRYDVSFAPPAPSRVSMVVVTFEPGARLAWHSHPLGQTLIVTSGVGWTQCGNSPIVEMRPGDMVWCPPGVKHWHGASPTSAMTHIAIYELLDGKSVGEWGEKVSDAEYLKGPPKP